MKTALLTASDLSKALETLRAGGIVAYPTETFYALGSDPLQTKAMERLRLLKGDRQNKPFPLLLPSMDYASKLVQVDELAARLMRQFWPGPLTLILRALDATAAYCSSDGTVGIRVSSHPIAQQLLAACGTALTSTSANPSQAAPATHADQVRGYFGQGVEILAGGITPGDKPSTVVRLWPSFEIVREGAISNKVVTDAVAKA